MTAYLAARTLVPLVLDRLLALEAVRVPLLARMRRQPARYVPASLRHGVRRPWPENCELSAAADADAGLPAETWMEVLARRQAFNRVAGLLAAGEIQDSSDMLTANLDLRCIARDAIALLDESKAEPLLQATSGLRVLDPTCGNGQFLVAAFDVLLELEAALGMRLGSPGPSRTEVAKAIVERQLFGVDLSERTVTICQERLCDRARQEGARRVEAPGVRHGNAVVGFDWAVEFPEATSAGGFQSILGNPPYLATHSLDYEPEGPHFHVNVYGHVLDAALALCHLEGAIGMVVPLSLCFGREQEELRQSLIAFGDGWFASFDNIPAPLFAGISQRCTIWLGRRRPAPVEPPGSVGRRFVTGLRRWRAPFRPHLLATLSYTQLEDSARGQREPSGVSTVPPAELPRIAGEHQRVLLAALTRASHGPAGIRKGSVAGAKRNPEQGADRDRARLGYSQTGRNFLSVFRTDPPCFDAATLEPVPPTKIASLQFETEERADAALAALCGDVFFWYWLARGDGFDLAGWLVDDFVSILETLPGQSVAELARLGRILHARRAEALVFKKNAGRYVGNYNWRKLGELCRQGDRTLLASLGLTAKVQEMLHRDVQRTLAVNAFAGEKGIPPELRRRAAEAL